MRCARAYCEGLRVLWVALAGVCAALPLPLLGCGAAPVRIEICGPPDLNGRVPLTVVARGTSRNDHQEETYSAATQRASQPDEARLWYGPLSTSSQRPLRRRVEVYVPEDRGLGIYFLFAEPYGSWKVFFEKPLSGTVRIELEPKGIRRAMHKPSKSLRPPKAADAPALPGAPEKPEAPALPEKPEAPAVPEKPAPPALPGLPGAPAKS